MNAHKTVILLFFLLSGMFLTLQGKELPRIHILATGGTIAGVGASSTGSEYKPGVVGIEQLLAAVPDVKQVASVTGEQLVTIASQDMTNDVWIKLALTINRLLARDDIDGIVVTHGTDTMEETAYFLNLTVKSDKPVILTGAMRPSTSLSADGPLNLFNAVVTAGAKESIGQGVLVVLNGTILGARDAIKTNTVDVQTFQSPNTGIMGYVYNGKVHYQMKSIKRHTSRSVFEVSEQTTLPKVGILYGYAHVGMEPLEAMLRSGYSGIIYAGVGNGNIHKTLFPLLKQARADNILVVRASRTPAGPVTLNGEVNDEAYGFIASGELNPQKARILLMLALAKTKDRQTIQTFFEEY